MTTTMMQQCSSIPVVGKMMMSRRLLPPRSHSQDSSSSSFFQGGVRARRRSSPRLHKLSAFLQQQQQRSGDCCVLETKNLCLTDDTTSTTSFTTSASATSSSESAFNSSSTSGSSHSGRFPSLLSFRSSSSSSGAAAAYEEEEEEEGDSSSSSLRLDPTSRSYSPFARQLESIQRDPRKPTLIVLKQFTEKSTKNDVVQLRDLLMDDSRPWRMVKIVDTQPGKNFRRAQFKKEYICRYLKDVAKDKSIDIQFACRLQVNVEDSPGKHIVSMLEEVKKDAEIQMITIKGHMDLSKARKVLPALTNLCMCDDRRWEAVVVDVAFVAAAASTTNTNSTNGSDPARHNSHMEYRSWQHMLERYKLILGEIAMERGIPIGIVTRKQHQLV